mmetsp:Transcript_23682/g.34513  ORF Transcript_23682/g.34513 Transcript_23682/m.34513 type:complete len:111 (+) Transcript_23682:46-378(+)
MPRLKSLCAGSVFSRAHRARDGTSMLFEYVQPFQNIVGSFCFEKSAKVKRLQFDFEQQLALLFHNHIARQRDEVAPNSGVADLAQVSAFNAEDALDPLTSFLLEQLAFDC